MDTCTLPRFLLIAVLTLAAGGCPVPAYGGPGGGADRARPAWLDRRPPPKDLPARVEALPDISGPGAVLRAGRVHMKVTNFGHVGNIFTNLSSDPAGQWPGPSGVEYLNSIRLAVAAKDSLTSDLSRVHRVSYLFNWRPATLDPVDHIYEAHAGITNGARFSNDDGDSYPDPVSGDRVMLIDEDFLDGHDNDGDGLVDEDYGAVGDQMYSLAMWDNTAEAVAADSTYLPLGLECRQLAWSYSLPGFSDFNVVNYTIYNRSGHALDSAYVGWAVDMDCGPVTRGNYFLDDLDLPGFPSGEFTLALPAEDKRRQLPHAANLTPSVADDSALCPRIKLRVNGFAVSDDDGDGGQTPGIGTFLLVDHSVDPLGRSAPSRVGFRAFRSFVGGTPYDHGGNPATPTQRYEFMSGTENVDSSGFISAAPATSPGDYVQWCSIGPFRNLPDGGSIQATIIFAVQQGDHATGVQYARDYQSYRNGTLPAPELFTKYPVLKVAYDAQLAFEGAYEANLNFPAPSFHGRETPVRLRLGEPPISLADCHDEASGTSREVTARSATWFDSDCDYCTGIWDYAAQTGLLHHTWQVPPSLPVAPTPTLVSLVSAEADAERVLLKWFTSDVLAGSYALYRRREGEDWRVLSRVEPDGTGQIAYEDRAIQPGERYEYRLGIQDRDGERFVGETWITVPRIPALSLDGLRPNPASGDLIVSFSLSSTEPATIELLDLAGRLVFSRPILDPHPGVRVLNLRENLAVPPGLYLVRLIQGGESISSKACVVR